MRPATMRNSAIYCCGQPGLRAHVSPSPSFWWSWGNRLSRPGYQPYISSYTVLLVLLILLHDLYGAIDIESNLVRNESAQIAGLYCAHGRDCEPHSQHCAGAAAGIVGDAIGTAIPGCLVPPSFFCRAICAAIWIFLCANFSREAYAYPLLLCVPLTLVLLFMQHNFYAHRYPQLILNLTAGTLVYGVGLVWFVVTKESIGFGLKARMGREPRAGTSES